MLKVLELFAGTRSIGKAFEAHGHDVFAVEWDKRFENIDLYADILTVTAAQILKEFGRPDVIWASPDCTTSAWQQSANTAEKKQTETCHPLPTMLNSAML